MNTFTTEGIVLKRHNIGEADKIITLFSKHYGKISCLAKGVRKITSRKKGSLEIFSQVKIFVARGTSLGIIAETESINNFGSWRKDLKKVACAYQACEMIDKLTADEHEQEDVYFLLFSFLSDLNAKKVEELEKELSLFAQKLLKQLGFWPKDKGFSTDFNTFFYIEQLMEKELKSKDFFKKI